MKKEGLAEAIINSIDFDDITAFLLQLVFKIMTTLKLFESEDRLIV
jgi:hypothetical protein